MMFIRCKILLCLLGAVFFIAGCSSTPKPKEKKIVIWHWMNDRKSAFNALAQKYEQQTKIPVEFKLFFPPDIYSQKVIAAARAGNLPEIFGILAEKNTLSSFIKAGHILDLTQFMQKDNFLWQDSFYPQTLDVVAFKENNTYAVDPGIYGVPIDTTIMQFIYNKSLAEAAGLGSSMPPQTFSDFIKYAQIIKNKLGVDGFICGWGEGWLLNCLATEWAINLLGEEKFLQTIEGKVPYTDPLWIEVFSLFSQLRDSGIIAPNITTMINKESEDAFSKGKVAFSFNGSWSANVYNQLASNLNYAFFPLPKISDKFPLKIWGGAGSAFMVNNKSPNKEEAVKFLKWLTLKEQQIFLIKETNNLPAIKGCTEYLPAELAALTKDLNSLTHPNIWPYNEDSRVIEILNKGLQQIVMGIKTPEEIAVEIQEVKKRTIFK